MNDEINLLTRTLYAQGYTRENYPDYVVPSYYQNFEYKFEHLKSMVWEAPCGRQTNQIPEFYGDLWYNGIYWCAENNNPRFSCPPDCGLYCEHREQKVPKGMSCVFHLSQKPYDYENSIDYLWKVWDSVDRKKYIEITDGAFCACVGSLGDDGKCEIKYDIQSCINFGCKNEVCCITKRPRDLTKVNIFYDIKRTWITRVGFLEETRIEIEKGCKVFKKACAKTDAETWLKLNEKNASQFKPKKTAIDRAQSFFSRVHRTWTGYDYFEFIYEAQNLRIAKSDTRDLEQDLADISEGIAVVHTSDLQKAAKQKKRDAKEKRLEAKNRKIVKNTKMMLEKYSDVPHMKEVFVKSLSKQGIDVSELSEQTSFL